MIGNRSWLLGIVGGLGWVGLTPWVGAQELSLPPLETSVSIDLSTQERVSDSLVILCEGLRCEDYRRDIRVQIRSGETLQSLQSRVVSAMRAEADRVFSAPGVTPERLVITGYAFFGSDTFVDREVPLFVMFVPRHRWLVGRYGVEQDGIYYGELVESQLAGILASAPEENGATGVEGDGGLALPELPPLEDETEAVPVQESPPLPGQIERRPISP